MSPLEDLTTGPEATLGRGVPASARELEGDDDRRGAAMVTGYVIAVLS